MAAAAASTVTASALSSVPARLLGRKPVQGALNDISLSLLVTDLRKSPKAQDLRCSLSVGDKRLLVTYTKRDEGFFESDGESSSSPSPPSASSDNVKNSSDVNVRVEEKIIKDHVFQLPSSDDSCAGDSSDEQLQQLIRGSPNSNGSTTSGTSSKSTSPTAEIQKELTYKFDHSESFPINDVLFCHTDRELRTCIVWVIRNGRRTAASKDKGDAAAASPTSDLEALVFECASEEDVKEVYRKFLELSKRSKLERHRRRKSDGAVPVTRSSDAIFRSRGEKVRSLHLNAVDININGGSQPPASLSAQQQQQQKPQQLQQYKSIAVFEPSSTSGNNNNNKGIDIVKYESPPKAAGLGSNNSNRYSLVQHTDRNGVTHIEVESNSNGVNKVSSVAIGSSNSGSKSISSSAAAPEIKKPDAGKSKFALELESILSKELESRQDSTASPKVSTATTTTTAAPSLSSSSSKSKGAIPRASLGESLSLRQRAPALLLKKLDEFEEKAARVWAKAEAEESQRREQEEERSRRVWGHGRHPSKMASRTPPPPSKRHHMQMENTPPPPQSQGGAAAFWKAKFKGGSNNNPSVNDTSTSSSPSLGFKLSAPSPPPFVGGEKSAASSPAVSPRKEAASKQNSNSGSDKQILVPTKTGKEPVKKLYPKETNPEMQQMRNAQAVAVAAAAAQQQARYIQFTPAATMQSIQSMQYAAASQPHSLPAIFPVPIAWARYPTEFTAQEQQLLAVQQAQVAQVQAAQAQWARAAQAAAMPNGGAGGSVAARGRSRDRVRIDTDQRRRAQSKSPARRPASTSGYDSDGSVMLNSSGSSEKSKGNISRKFREFSDAVRLRMSRKSGSNAAPQPMTGLDMPDGMRHHHAHAHMMPAHLQQHQQQHSHPQQLKSNLKKQNCGEAATASSGNDSETSNAPVQAVNNNNNNDGNKKVHFNKFATVQMME